MNIEKTPEQNEELRIMIEKIKVFFQLSKAQIEVLKMTSEGKKYKQISYELHITEGAIKQRIKLVKEKIFENKNFSSSYESFYGEIIGIGKMISLVTSIPIEIILSHKNLFIQCVGLLYKLHTEEGQTALSKLKSNFKETQEDNAEISDVVQNTLKNIGEIH